MHRRALLQATLAAAAGAVVRAGDDRPAAPVIETPIRPTTGIDLPVLGALKARAAKEIGASSWSIGAETLDRDFTVYDHFKRYLGPLGAKGVRLQAGWAKCERKRGTYSWEWLDAIVDDAVGQGVQPWLEASYGNKQYSSGGGDTGLGGGLPSSAEALAGWDRWVRALVERYRDRVHEWEVWNEPDLNKTGTAPVTAYADLFVRTATIVRAVQPKGRLYALALAHDVGYAARFIDTLKERGRLDLVDAITFHTYPNNPDATGIVDRLRQLIAKAGRDIQVRQGETGAPSAYQASFALSGIHWTETMQAKWNLRRLLAHHAKRVPMNLFTLCDMHYGAGGRVQMNYKGLLATHPDRTVARVKPSYRAAQCVFTVFDDTLEPIADYSFKSTALRTLAVTGYGRKDGGQAVVYWFSDAPPDDGCGATAVDLTLPAGRFSDPVLVDLRTGLVHAVAKDRWSRAGSGVTFRSLPACDSPMLLIERTAAPLVSRKGEGR
ncbi:MAG: hypothetical protein U0736_25180 [Gemmataceae bacterium]